MMDIDKVKEFSFLNEEVEEFTSRWIQNLGKKSSNVVYEA